MKVLLDAWSQDDSIGEPEGQTRSQAFSERGERIRIRQGPTSAWADPTVAAPRQHEFINS